MDKLKTCSSPLPMNPQGAGVRVPAVLGGRRQKSAGSVRIRAARWASFNAGRIFVKSLRLESKKEWQEYSKNSKRPSNIPSHPDRTYRDAGWVSWSDWLGYEGKLMMPKGGALPFDAARIFVRSLKLGGRKEWQEYSKNSKRPSNIPGSPHQTYRDAGWTSYPDWLGYKGRLCGKRSRPFLLKHNATNADDADGDTEDEYDDGNDDNDDGDDDELGESDWNSTRVKEEQDDGIEGIMPSAPAAKENNGRGRKRRSTVKKTQYVDYSDNNITAENDIIRANKATWIDSVGGGAAEGVVAEAKVFAEGVIVAGADCNLVDLSTGKETSGGGESDDDHLDENDSGWL